MIRALVAVIVGTAVLAACASGPRVTTATSQPPSDSVASSSPTPSASPSLGQLRVVGLGDSVMAGNACSCRDLLQQYADALAARTHRSVRSDNLGVDGAVTSDVLDALRSDARTRDVIAQADVVVVVIGANDLIPQLEQWRASSCPSSCFGPPVQQMGRQLAQVLDALQSARNGRTDHVLVADYWNVFQDGQVAVDADGREGVAWSTKVTTAANAAICQAAQSAQATCVDLFSPFKGSGEDDPTGLLADDGDHPNAAGTRVIAQALIGATPGDL